MGWEIILCNTYATCCVFHLAFTHPMRKSASKGSLCLIKKWSDLKGDQEIRIVWRFSTWYRRRYVNDRASKPLFYVKGSRQVHNLSKVTAVRWFKYLGYKNRWAAWIHNILATKHTHVNYQTVRVLLAPPCICPWVNNVKMRAWLKPHYIV